MTQAVVFANAVPADAARALDDTSIHLWRIRYARSEGRVPLARLLAAYLGRPPADVTLVDAAGGKPRLAGATRLRGAVDGAPSLEFNWSHSGRYALVAVARAVPLGVDIEHVRPRLRALELAQRFFAPPEAVALGAIGADARDAAFIALWCAKEAVLKARGEGLAFGLARVAFAPGSEGAWRPLAIDAALGGTVGWQVMQFSAAARYRGAVAWRGAPRRLRAFQLRET